MKGIGIFGHGGGGVEFLRRGEVEKEFKSRGQKDQIGK